MPGPTYDPAEWSLRPDGSKKGNGFLGPLALPNGSVATEYSIADSERLKDAKGNYIDYPSLVPTLTPEEVAAVLKAAADTSGKTKLPDSVYDKAEAHALQRRAQGKPLFASIDEQDFSLHPQFKRAVPVGADAMSTSRRPGSASLLEQFLLDGGK